MPITPTQHKGAKPQDAETGYRAKVRGVKDSKKRKKKKEKAILS